MQNNLTPGAAGEIFLYQDSRLAGSVHRFVVTLTMHVRKERLEQAVNELMPRFMHFAAGVRKSGDSMVLVPVEAAVPVFEYVNDPEKGSLPGIGSDGLGGYLFRVSCSRKSVFFDWHLALSDGKGMLEFVKAVVFRYVQICGFPVRNDGTVKEAEEPSNAVEGIDPYERLDDIPASRPVWYMDARAFNVPLPENPEDMERVHVQQIRIPVAKVKGHVREYVSQPESFISPLFSHVLYERFCGQMQQGEYIVSTIKENLRPHFPSASLRSYFAPVSLAYNRKVDEYPFGTVLMSRKKLLDAQLKHDALAYSAKRMMKTVSLSCGDGIPFNERVLRAEKCMDTDAGTATFSICNVGNIAMPESLQQYIVEIYPIVPSGSYASSLSIVNFKGDLTVTVCDRNEGMDIAVRFVELLNRQDIPAFVSDEFQFTQIRYLPEKIADNG